MSWQFKTAQCQENNESQNIVGENLKATDDRSNLVWISSVVRTYGLMRRTSAYTLNLWTTEPAVQPTHDIARPSSIVFGG